MKAALRGALLATWCGLASAAPQVPTDDAVVLERQYRHEFDAALADFARVLDRDAGHFGARAWRAALFMVRADYAAAARECAALPGDARDLYAVGCRAYAAAATGKMAAAYAEL